MRRSPAAALTAAVVSTVVLVTGCGTRVDEATVRAGAQADGAVTLDQASLDQLRASTAAPAVVDAPVSTAAGPGLGPSGTTPSTEVGSVAPGASTAAAPRPRSGGEAAVSAAATGRCTTAGAPVMLGQVGTFSGLAGPIAGDGLAAMAVWAKEVNARGGLACHPVTLLVRDDGGDPARAAAAVQDLVGRGVVAFVGNITALSQPGFLPEIRKSCTPAIGIDFGPEWGTEPCLFPQGGGWNESIAGLVRQAKERDHSKLGLL